MVDNQELKLPVIQQHVPLLLSAGSLGALMDQVDLLYLTNQATAGVAQEDGGNADATSK